MKAVCLDRFDSHYCLPTLGRCDTVHLLSTSYFAASSNCGTFGSERCRMYVLFQQHLYIPVEFHKLVLIKLDIILVEGKDEING